jgi:hypothetical protein
MLNFEYALAPFKLRVVTKLDRPRQADSHCVWLVFVLEHAARGEDSIYDDKESHKDENAC